MEIQVLCGEMRCGMEKWEVLYKMKKTHNHKKWHLYNADLSF